MASKEIWNKIFDDFDSMTDKEFLAFLDESEQMPNIPIVIPDIPVSTDINTGINANINTKEEKLAN